MNSNTDGTDFPDLYRRFGLHGARACGRVPVQTASVSSGSKNQLDQQDQSNQCTHTLLILVHKTVYRFNPMKDMMTIDNPFFDAAAYCRRSKRGGGEGSY